MTSDKQMRDAFHRLMDDMHIGNNFEKVRDAEIIWDSAVKAALQSRPDRKLR
jgi:hypothetical protein